MSGSRRRLRGVEVRPVASDVVTAITDDSDLGERSAIALAETPHADLRLIDEAAGRAEAKRRQLRVTGTLGVHIGEEDHALGPGDSIYFDSGVQHGYRRSGTRTCTALVVTAS